VKAMCDFFGISRAAYYEWVKRKKRPDPDATRLQLVQEAYEKSRRTYGYRRITLWLRQHKQVVINHKTVLRLMRKLGIQSIARRRKIYTKLDQMSHYHRYPNQLNRDFSASQPNQKWVTDITWFNTRQGWGYLVVIKDLFDGFIVAHRTSPQQSVSLVTAALRLAKQREEVTDGLILHSDQGSPYVSHAYFCLTHKYNITPSMSRPGNCWDNAPAENFFSHLKEEALRHLHRPSFQEASQFIDDYISFYNYERIQLKTGLTPFQLRCRSG
jgi:putative transposase